MEGKSQTVPPSPNSSEFRRALKIGPDRRDLLSSRPYFLVDVEVNGPEEVAERIVGFLRSEREAVSESAPYRPITDIYVSSHGWHRNLFRSVSTYDRLTSRLAVLFRRGRLTEYIDVNTYSPLHLNLHWNSDVEMDDWVDLDGRKRKDDFLDKVVGEFEPVPGGAGTQAGLVNLMEDIYQYITTTAAPDINPLEHKLKENSKGLFTRLGEYQILSASDATMPEKVVMVWTKYHESSQLSATQEQPDKPRSYSTPVQRLMRASSFLLRVLIPVIGLSALLDPFKSLFDLPFLKPVFAQTLPVKVGEFLAAYTVLYFISWAMLLWARRATKAAREASKTYRFSQAPSPVKAAKPLDLPCILAWAIMQVAHVIPVLAYCMLTYPSIVGLSISWFAIAGAGIYFSSLPHADVSAIRATASGLIGLWVFLCWTQWYGTNVAFDERAGARGKEPNEKKLAKAESGPRAKWTSGFASYPSQLAHDADVPYSRAYGLWDVVRSQLGYFRMQMRAVSRAAKARDVLCKLLSECEKDSGLIESKVRIHLFGHSFGGLVVANLAKHLAYEREPVPVQTVCTIQGAYASDWFVGEDKTLNNVKGWIAAIFTQYDTATGAMYSLASGGRNGCGSIGLCSTRDNPIGKSVNGNFKTYAPLPSASLSYPPDLIERLKLVDTVIDPDAGCPVLNIDCSRFMSEGPVATGGHTTIFLRAIPSIRFGALLISRLFVGRLRGRWWMFVESRGFPEPPCPES